MKRIRSLVLIALILSAVMPSCKKGENDPFISIRSRKARVAGEWKVTSGKGDQSQTGSFSYSSSWTYDGSMYTETGSSSGNSRVRTIEYTFDKDGTFTMTDVDGGETTTIEGVWNFSSGVGEMKNKSQLVLSYNKITDPSGVETFTGFLPWATYDIDELRNNKMVLKWHYESSSSGSSSVQNEEWVLEAK